MEQAVELQVAEVNDFSTLAAAIRCTDFPSSKSTSTSTSTSKSSSSSSSLSQNAIILDNSLDKSLSLFRYESAGESAASRAADVTFHYALDQRVESIAWLGADLIGIVMTADEDQAAKGPKHSLLLLLNASLALLGTWALSPFSSSAVVDFHALQSECWLVFEDGIVLGFKVDSRILSEPLLPKAPVKPIDTSPYFSRVQLWRARGQSKSLPRAQSTSRSNWGNHRKSHRNSVAIFSHSKYNASSGTLFVSVGASPFVALYKADPLYFLPIAASSQKRTSAGGNGVEGSFGVRKMAAAMAGRIKQRLEDTVEKAVGSGGRSGIGEKQRVAKDVDEHKKETISNGNADVRNHERTRKPVDLEKVCALHDPARRGISISPADPSNRYCASLDAFGRVSLLDIRHSLRIIHVFKGFRDAQVGWMTASEAWPQGHENGKFDNSGHLSGNLALYLVLLAPQRRRLQIWRMPYGPTVDSINLDQQEPASPVEQHPKPSGFGENSRVDVTTATEVPKASAFRLISGCDRNTGLAWTFLLSWHVPSAGGPDQGRPQLLMRKIRLELPAVEKVFRHVRRSAKQSEGLLLYEIEKLCSSLSISRSSSSSSMPSESRELANLIKQASSPGLLQRALVVVDGCFDIPLLVRKEATKAAVQVIAHCTEQIEANCQIRRSAQTGPFPEPSPALAKLHAFGTVISRRLAVIEGFEALESAIQVADGDDENGGQSVERDEDFQNARAWLPSSYTSSPTPPKISLHALLSQLGLLFGQPRGGRRDEVKQRAGIAQMIYSPLLVDVFVLNAVEEMERLLSLSAEERVALFVDAWMQSAVSLLFRHPVERHPALRWMRRQNEQQPGHFITCMIKHLRGSLQLVHALVLCDLLMLIPDGDDRIEDVKMPEKHPAESFKEKVSQVLLLRRLLGDFPGLSVAAVGSSEGENSLANVIAMRQIAISPAPNAFSELLAWREKFRVVPKQLSRGSEKVDEVKRGRVDAQEAVGWIAGWAGRRWAKLAGNICCHRSLLLLREWEEQSSSSGRMCLFWAAVENATTVDEPIMRAALSWEIWNLHAAHLTQRAMSVSAKETAPLSQRSETIATLKSLMRLLDILRDAMRMKSNLSKINATNVVENVELDEADWPNVGSDAVDEVVGRFVEVKDTIGVESVRVQFTLLHALCAVMEQIPADSDLRKTFSPEKLFHAPCVWFTPEALYLKEEDIREDASCRDLKRKVVFALLESKPERAERAYALGAAFDVDAEEVKAEHIQVLYSCGMDDLGEEALLQVEDMQRVFTGLLGIARRRLAAALKKLEADPQQRNRLALVSADARRWILAAYLEGRDVLKEDTGTVDQTLVLLRQLEQTAETLKDASTRKHFEELLRTAEILQDAT